MLGVVHFHPGKIKVMLGGDYISNMECSMGLLKQEARGKCERLWFAECCVHSVKAGEMSYKSALIQGRT